jgi:hypothetical protein
MLANIGENVSKTSNELWKPLDRLSRRVVDLSQVEWILKVSIKKEYHP